jgi:hypothetical protein
VGEKKVFFLLVEVGKVGKLSECLGAIKNTEIVRQPDLTPTKILVHRLLIFTKLATKEIFCGRQPPFQLKHMMAGTTEGGPRLTLNDGRAMPQLGFGTYCIDAKDARHCVKEAIALGYRHIDTAAGQKCSKLH